MFYSLVGRLPIRRCIMLLAAMSLSLLTGCAAFYVDSSTKEIPSSSFAQKTTKRPVQLLFEFQTKGTVNARVTELVKAKVLTQVKESNLFTDVTDSPVPGGALLAISVNNVPITDNAFSQGFVTGLTFGLAGSKVSDGYVCTATYSSAPGAKAIEKLARHAIHTTIGAADAPGNATRAENLEQAFFTMLHQVVSNVLNDVSNDSTFN